MLSAPLRILIVAALCVISLVGLVVRESMARDSGTEVLLAMEAVDPRSLLSGHYVIVGLQENLPEGETCPPAYIYEDWIGPQPRQEIPTDWIALSRSGDTYRVAMRSLPSREEALSIGAVAVLGTSFCNPRQLDERGAVIQPASQQMDLGISRFHINQADAERIDRMLRAQTPDSEQRIFAIVSIGRDGRARLKGLSIDGERLELSWL